MKIKLSISCLVCALISTSAMAASWVASEDHEENTDKVEGTHDEFTRDKKTLLGDITHEWTYTPSASVTDNKSAGDAKWASADFKQYYVEDPYGANPTTIETTFLTGYCKNVTKPGWHLGAAWAKTTDPPSHVNPIEEASFTNTNATRYFIADPTGHAKWIKRFRYQDDSGQLCTINIPEAAFYTHVELECNYSSAGSAENGWFSKGAAITKGGFDATCQASPKDSPVGDTTDNNRNMSGSFEISRTEDLSWTINGNVGWSEKDGFNVNLGFTVSSDSKADWWNETGPTDNDAKHHEWLGFVTNENAIGANSPEVSLTLTWLCEAEAKTLKDAPYADASWSLSIIDFTLSANPL